MVAIRPAGPADVDVLVDALLAASNWDGTERQRREQVVGSRYVAGWQRPDDFGVVAEDEHGVGVGAAWFRYLPADDPGYGFVAPDVPELTIGVALEARGRGVGTALLTALLATADERGCRAVSLSVEDGNAARRLYERSGFVRVGRNGGSDTLVRTAAPTPGAATT